MRKASHIRTSPSNVNATTVHGRKSVWCKWFDSRNWDWTCLAFTASHIFELLMIMLILNNWYYIKLQWRPRVMWFLRVECTEYDASWMWSFNQSMNSTNWHFQIIWNQTYYINSFSVRIGLFIFSYTFHLISTF